VYATLGVEKLFRRKLEKKLRQQALQTTASVLVDIFYFQDFGC